VTLPDTTPEPGRGEIPGRAVSGRVQRLVDELRHYAGLSEVDAHRAAFIALALTKGWSKARIARYLGISRARVGQKVEKLDDYVFEHGRRMASLKRARQVGRSAKPHGDAGAHVAFNQEDWDDLEFAGRLCDMVA
jgi:biotin operon repressor